MGGVANIFLLLTIWTTVLITWHRFVNICIPLKGKHWGTLCKAKIQMAIIATSSLLVSLPKFFERDLVADTPDQVSIGMLRGL